MRLLVAALLPLYLFACSDNRDVCDSYPGQACIALLLVSSQPLTIDEVRVTPLLGFSGGTRSSSFPPAALPVTFALVPEPNDTGPFRMNVSGYQGGTRQGYALVNGQVLANSHSRIRAELIADQALSDGGSDAPASTDGGPSDFSSSDRSTSLVDGGAVWSRLGVNTQSGWITTIWGGDADHVIASGDSITLRSINRGSSWTQENPGLGWVTGVWGFDAANLVAVGWQGVAYTSDNSGVSWGPAVTPSANDIYGVFGFGSSAIYAVGKAGSLLFSSDGGKKWAKIDSGYTTNFNCVWGSSASDVFIGGDGVLLHSQNGWSSSSNFSVGATSVTKIWGTDASHIFALASDDKDTQFLSYNGSDWQNSFAFYGFYGSSLWGTSTSNIYVAGNSSGRGRIFHWNGSDWSEEILPANSPLILDIFGFGANDIYAVGESFIHHFP